MASNRSVRRAQEPVTYTCTLCESEDGVRWYCNDCKDILCDRCKEAHKRGGKTKNDDVVPIGEANRHVDKPVPEVCTLHPGKLCDMYCSDCDVLLCSICLFKTHKQHICTLLEEELSVRKGQITEHLTTIGDKIKHFKNVTSECYRANKAYTDNIDAMKKDVNSQRVKLKAEVDSIADTVLDELISLEKEESMRHKKNIQQQEKTVQELTRLYEKTELTVKSGGSLLETETTLRTTLPLYDVTVKHALPKHPRFVTGRINRTLITKMLGELHRGNEYEEKDIDSKHVQCLSKFTVPQRYYILCIITVDDSHAWLSVAYYKGLFLVNGKGVVSETVQLDFEPYMITVAGITDILMTSNPPSRSVYKLSLHNKQVTTFADIRPNKACDISINERGEVFVSTNTPDIVVLNQSGTVVRKVTCGMDGWFITCLSSGDIAVSDLSKVSVITDNSGTARYKWTGELNNGQQVGSMGLRKMSCDKYDRLFVPDYDNHQVYVIPRDGTKATCLLDQKNGVKYPTAVGVDTCGNVWIGCGDGTVHVMAL